MPDEGRRDAARASRGAAPRPASGSSSMRGPLQEPERAPLTAAYLDGLLGAFDADPLPGESFAFLLRSDLDDPTGAYEHLDVVGRRLLPPTRLLRSAALTIDPFLLRGASLGAAWRAEQGGAAGAVYHAAGAGPLPIASGLPIVATLLDLAPWELPEVVRADRRPRASASGCGPSSCARRPRSSSRAPASRRPRAGVLRIRADRLRVVAARAATRRSASSIGPRPAEQPNADADPRARAPRAARALLRLLRPLRRSPGPRHAPAGARRAGRGRPSAELAADVAVAAADPAASAPARRTAPRSPGRRPPGHRRAASATRRSSRRPPWPASSAAPAPRSCRSSPTRPAWPPSRRSPAGRRSSPRRSARCPDLVGSAGILVEPRDPERLAVALRDRVGRRPGARPARRQRPRAGRPGSVGRGPTWPARRARSTRRSASGSRPEPSA